MTRITYSPACGCDGLFVDVPVESGSLVFSEAPLNFLQSIPNKQDVPVCGSCYRFLGSIDTQVKLLRRVVSRGEGLLETRNDGCLLLSCSCGELYCNEDCKGDHYNRGHKYLCTGHLSEEDAMKSPLVQFKIHAVQTNEIFLLVADIFAKVITSVEGGVSTSEAILPWNNYVRNMWHTVAVDKPSKKKSGGKKKSTSLSDTLRSLVTDSYTLLGDALQLQAKGLDGVLSEEYFSRTIGMFEQNNVGVRLDSPVLQQVHKVSTGATADVSSSYLLEVANEIIAKLEDVFEDCSSEGCESSEEEEEEEGDDEGEKEVNESTNEETINSGDASLDQLLTLLGEHGSEAIFPPLDGTAFYTKICKINHSCEPNCIVRYSSDPLTGALVAQLFALRDLEPGQELLQSYIDGAMSAKRRQEALADYGFVCRCARCKDA